MATTTVFKQPSIPMYDKLFDLGNHKLVQIGFGGIGSAMIQLFTKHFVFRPSQIIVIEMKPELCEQGSRHYPDVKFINLKVTRENYERTFAKLLRPGDMLLDLAWYIDSTAEIEWCHYHNVIYVNTAMEWWEVDQTQSNVDPRELTLYKRQLQLQQKIADWDQDTINPTAILTHGANPGWVSHATKFGLRDWTEFILSNPGKFGVTSDLANKMKQAVLTRSWGELARLLNVQVIHIAEKDTLRSRKIKELNEFICTWSPQGFIEEGMAPAELGWGTHENLEKGVYKYSEGPKHQVCFATRGMNTRVQSFVPSGNMVGMVIRHEEAYSIPEYLSVFDKYGNPVYRPTVHYCYQPCNDTVASVYEFTSSGYKEPKKERIPKKDLLDGVDELGLFMLSKDFGAWWIGATQSVNDSLALLPGQGPTVTLVAAGVLGAVVYAFKHPNLGVIHPESMDEKETMSYILPYLMPFKSMFVEGWEPHVQAVFGEGDVKSDDWTIQRLLASKI